MGSSDSSVVAQKLGGTDGGNGGMDDVLKRLHTVEQTVSDIKADVVGIKTSIPYLATKSDLSDVRTDLTGVHGSLKTQITKSELAIIKWLVGTALGIGALAFAIARYIAPA